MYVLVEGDRVVEGCDDLDSRTWLESTSRGAYTTARTVNNASSVFELDAHIERLAITLKLMFDDETDEIISPEKLRPLILKSLRAGITHFRNLHDPSPEEELKLTILLVWHSTEQSLNRYCHVGKLPAIPSPPIKIEIRGAPRQNAKAKDSQWVRDRKHLEDLKPNDVNEIILHDADGCLLEGTQTNFYVIQDDKLYTAGEGVLEGTVRRLILQVCQTNAVPVILSPPRLSDLSKWQDCLISSTSRLALPVDWIGVPGEGRAFDASLGDVSKAFVDQPLAKRIAELVKEQVVAASTAIF